MSLRCVVIGGGISGLAAAHRLLEVGRATSLPIDLTVLEARPQLGGVIRTESRDGFLLEHGPDSFLTEKPWALDLCRRLGLADELIQTQPGLRRSFIVHRKELVPVPEGLRLMAGARLGPLLRSPLLSWPGKLRMAMEPLVPPSSDARDESLAQFVRRRLGREVLERIAQPMVGGIYTADPEALSLDAAMPRFRVMERRYGNLTNALRRSRRQRAGCVEACGPRYSLFASLRGGMGRLIEALEARVSAGCVKRASPAERLEPGEAWTIHMADGRRLEADMVCVALPTHAAARLLAGAAPDLSQRLSSIPYETVLTVNLGYRKTDVPRRLEGFGFVVPIVEQRPLVGCSFSSLKFAGRAPQDGVLVRAFVGGAMHRELTVLTDEAVQRVVQDELRELLGVSAQPRCAAVHRHEQAMPQYHVGHLDRVASIEAAVQAVPGLYLTSNGLRGMGIPDCIDHAERTAEQMLGAALGLERGAWAA